MMTIFPLVLFFALGYIFKVYFGYSENTGQILSRITLNVTLPATIFLAVSNTKDFSQAYFLPLAAVVIQLSLFGIFLLFNRRLNLDENTECVFVTTPLKSNTLLFLAPFVYLAYGDTGLTRVMLYDMGNAITIYCIAQPIFMFYGSKQFNILSSFKTIFTSTTLWSFFIAIIVVWSNIIVPEIIIRPLSIMKEVNVFLPMFLLGFYFKPSLDKIRLVIFTVTFKMLFGLFIGIGLSFFFTNAMDKVILIMATAAPIGLTSLIFSSEYGKDTHFSSNIVSYSMLLGIIIYTILDYFFKYFGLI